MAPTHRIPWGWLSKCDSYRCGETEDSALSHVQLNSLSNKNIGQGFQLHPSAFHASLQRLIPLTQHHVPCGCLCFGHDCGGTVHSSDK
ncbi:hypothetical protein GN956_G16959 [Arapaima gigas]